MKTLPVMVIVCVVMTLTGADEASTGCGWFEYNGRCLLYIPKTMTWANAEYNCQTLGGNLASVHDVSEYQEIQRLIMISTNELGQAWLGGSDAEENSFWLWSDGTPFHYSNWCPGEPNNLNGSQHCIIMNHGESKCWDDGVCNVYRPSVCAKKI